jgi:hypothetical protein
MDRSQHGGSPSSRSAPKELLFEDICGELVLDDGLLRDEEHLLPEGVLAAQVVDPRRLVLSHLQLGEEGVLDRADLLSVVPCEVLHVLDEDVAQVLNVYHAVVLLDLLLLIPGQLSINMS